MIDLTPLDVRKKRGDFRRGLRGYESQEVDSFLDLAAERLEELVRENLQLRERVHQLHHQTEAQTQREEAVRDALVTAQELRTEIREQARTEAERIIEEARTEARRMIAEAEAEVRTRLRNSERQADHAVATLGVLERRRLRFLQSFRQLLERELDIVEVEEGRPPLEERSFDLDFGGAGSKGRSGGVSDPYALPDPDYEERADPGLEVHGAHGFDPLYGGPVSGAPAAADGSAETSHAPGPDEAGPRLERGEPVGFEEEDPAGQEPRTRRPDHLLLYLEPDDDRAERD